MLLTGCATPALTGAERVEEVFEFVQRTYYKAVSRGALQEACLAALGEARPPGTGPATSGQAFAQALDRARTISASAPGGEEAVDRCLQGVFRTLNRDSQYMTPREYEENSSGRRYAALGLELVLDNEGVRIVSVLEGSPAERGGVRPGLLIAQIEGRDLKGLPLSGVYGLLRGEAGSRVTISLRDDEIGPARPMTLVRQLIAPAQGMRVRWVEPGIAHVRISAFESDSLDKLVAGFAQLQRDSPGPLKGIVLDLRSNSGGLLDAAVGTAAAFLPRDALIASTLGRTAASSRSYFASPLSYQRPGQGDALARLPAQAKAARMVVMVNRATSSGAEIVAAALQDHKRAIVVGWVTHGKGSVETAQRLRGGGWLRVTSSTVWRPGGGPLQDLGVTPDVGSAAALGQHARFGVQPDPDPLLEEGLRVLKAPEANRPREDAPDGRPRDSAHGARIHPTS